MNLYVAAATLCHIMDTGQADNEEEVKNWPRSPIAELQTDYRFDSLSLR